MALEHKGEFQVEHGFGLPLHTTAERLAYTPSREGYQVFDTDLDRVFVFYNGVWHDLAPGDGEDGLGSKVNIDGDTMTGLLILSGDPVDPLGAATRQYVDSIDLTNFVTLDTAQTITGDKSFTGVFGVSSASPVVISNTEATGSVQLAAGAGRATLTTDSFVLGLANAAGGTADVLSVTDDSINLSFVGAADVIDFNVTSGILAIGTKVSATGTEDTDADNIVVTKGYLDTRISETATSLSSDDLTDVDTTTVAPVTGDVLAFDGTNFVNRALSASDVSGVATEAQGLLADSAVQPGDATSTLTNNDAFVDLTTAQTIAGVKTFSEDINANGSVTIAGDLVVAGTTTTVNSTNTDIADSIITLNKGETGAGVTNPNQSGLEIDRGTEGNKFLIWSESNDQFGLAEADAAGDVDVPTFRAFAYQDEVASSSNVTTFNTGDWTMGSPNTFTITQATHGVAVSDIYDVTVFEGTSKVSIEVDVAANGDVTLVTVGDVFAGRVKISL